MRYGSVSDGGTALVDDPAVEPARPGGTRAVGDVEQPAVGAEGAVASGYESNVSYSACEPIQTHTILRFVEPQSAVVEADADGPQLLTLADFLEVERRMVGIVLQPFKLPVR